MSQSGISPVRVVLIAAVLGTLGGIGLSLHRQRVEETQLEAMALKIDHEGTNAAPMPVDPPGKNAQAGHVHLTATEGLPQYPNAYVHPLTSAPHDGGMEMNIAWFSTKDSMDQVLNFYGKEFHDKHKRAVLHEFGPSTGYAAYLDHDLRLHMVSVIVQQHETLVFASSSYPQHMFDAARREAPDGLPAVAGAEGALSFDLNAGLGPNRKLFTSTFKQRTLADVHDAYKKALVDEGWTVVEEKAKGPQEARFDAKRGAGQLEVMIQRDAASNVAVYVSMSGA